MKKRVQVYYSGMVQGVGFRFTVDRLAQVAGVTGWVRNMRDGRVELTCEGDEIAITDFLKKIRSSALKSYIQDVETSWSDATGEFKSFEIKFW